MSQSDWEKIKVLHDKANDLMKKKEISDVNLRKVYKKLATHRKGTKVYQDILNRIKKMNLKQADLTREIVEVLREKDNLLKKVK